MIRVIEHKIYPSAAQVETLSFWLRVCCRTYNRALDHRIKAYKRRGVSPSLYSQQGMLTDWRCRSTKMRECPLAFERDALRRIDRAFKAFFSRVKLGKKPGFPRFKPSRRYNCLEALDGRVHSRGNRISIPKLGTIRSRGQKIVGDQRALRIIRRANGWFAQIMLDDGLTPLAKRDVKTSCGIDVGLKSFATLSDGTKVENPRFYRKSQSNLRRAQRCVSRRRKGSRRRIKALLRLRLTHERIAARRKDFCHQLANGLVKKYDLIAIEKLNVGGMVKNRRFSKSISDAAWSTFKQILHSKAENAGVTVVEVDARNTSQECSACGTIVAKEISERVHRCGCGCVIDRDTNAAINILNRASRRERGESLRPAALANGRLIEARSPD